MESYRRVVLGIGWCILLAHGGSLSAAIPIERIASIRQPVKGAAHASAVRIRGVVTAFSGRKNSFFLQDNSAGISVERAENAVVQVGQQLEVTGTLRSGFFTPVVVSQQIAVLGDQRPPPPLHPAYPDLARGQMDSQWIEVSGVVHAARVTTLGSRQILTLDLHMAGGRLAVQVFDFPPANFQYLVDSLVRVQGVCGSVLNDRRRGQPEALLLFTPRMEQIHIESPPLDPARIPLSPLENLRTFSSNPALERRVKIAGVVTYQRPDKLLYLQDGGAAVLVRTTQSGLFTIGTRVEAVGFLSAGSAPALLDASVRSLGPGVPPVPLKVPASALITTTDGFVSAPYDGVLVRLHAEIADRPLPAESQVWTLRDGTTVFQAEMGRTLNGHKLNLGPGSEVEVTGICQVDNGENGNPESFRLLVRSPLDFAVVHAPFWQVTRLFFITTLFIVSALALLARGFQWHLSKSGVSQQNMLSTVLVTAFARASQLTASTALIIAGLDLLGWSLGVEMLKRVAPGYVAMMPNTALAFLAAAIFFLLGRLPEGTRKLLQSICGLLVTAIGGLTLAEYLSGANLFIDGLVIGHYADWQAQAEPLRMAFVSALAFVLLGSALLLVSRQRHVLYAQWFAIGSGIVCILNLVGYLYGLENGEVGSNSFMAVHTAVCFVLLSLSVLFRSADAGVMTVISSDSLGGVMARRLIPASLLLPALIGWIRWQGEVTGLYDTVFGLAVFASANMAAFGFLIWTSAITLNRLDAQRSHSERELRLMVEGTRDYAIFMLDRDGRIASWNDGAERIKGYSAREAIGKHFSFLYEADDIAPEQSRAKADRALKAASAEGRFEEESWHVRRDGARFWGNVVISALKDEAGQLRGFSNVTRDATELKRANEDLVAACRRAEEANRAKSDFLAAMSHEIRTPMNSILGMTDLVMETGLNSIQREYVDRCRRAGANLLNLINDILDLSKIESSRFELEQIPFNLADLVRRTTELMMPKAEMKGIGLSTRLEPETPLVLVGDPFRLQQLLINLLGNAVKFTEEGEISLKISPCADDPGHLLFEVTDTGIGIAEDKLGIIFDDFTQAETSTTRRFGGSGLGLGIARRLANRMGGELTASSVLGKGSTFRFDARFTLSDEALPLEPPTPAHQLVGRRVLVIDGNPTNRMITSKMCFSWGMVPVEMASLAEAYELLSDQAQDRPPFSLAIMEVVTPGADGFDAFLKMRTLCPELPVIMTSSDSKPGEATRAKALGAAGYAVNPVRSTDLFRMVAAAVRPEQHEEFAKTAGKPDRGVSRILIAEDSEDNRFLLEAYLMDQPYEVTFVDNGEEAVAAFERDTFGLVLMDVQMPVMDGLKATELIRAFEREQGRSRTPILALTANAFLSDRELSQAAGCDGHLSKPISKGTLVSAVKASVLPVHTGETVRQHMP